MHLTVFSSSSDAVDPAFFDVASELGRTIASRGDTLVYGGTKVGLMGAVARAAFDNGGKVIGVIPRYIAEVGLWASSIGAGACLFLFLFGTLTSRFNWADVMQVAENLRRTVL